VSFSISATPSDDEVIQLSKFIIKWPKRGREILSIYLSQLAELKQESQYSNPIVRPRLINPTREKPFPHLNEIETIVYVCDRVGIGSVRMSAHLNLGERQIRRILSIAYEKVKNAEAG
jgi:hypothetical protein